MRALPVGKVPASLSVFVDLPVRCSAVIQGWSLFTKKAGVVFATIWSVSDDGSQLTLVGRNRLDVPKGNVVSILTQAQESPETGTRAQTKHLLSQNLFAKDWV